MDTTTQRYKGGHIKPNSFLKKSIILIVAYMAFINSCTMVLPRPLYAASASACEVFFVYLLLQFLSAKEISDQAHLEGAIFIILIFTVLILISVTARVVSPLR